MDSKNENKCLIDFGAKVKKLREQQNLTLVQMAFEMNCNEKQLRLIEKGSINTGILSVYKIALILDVEPKILFQEERSPNLSNK